MNEMLTFHKRRALIAIIVPIVLAFTWLAAEATIVPISPGFFLRNHMEISMIFYASCIGPGLLVLGTAIDPWKTRLIVLLLYVGSMMAILMFFSVTLGCSMADRLCI